MYSLFFRLAIEVARTDAMTIVRQTRVLVTCMLDWRGNDDRYRWTKRSTLEFQQTLNTFQAWLFHDENCQLLFQRIILGLTLAVLGVSSRVGTAQT